MKYWICACDTDTNRSIYVYAPTLTKCWCLFHLQISDTIPHSVQHPSDMSSLSLSLYFMFLWYLSSRKHPFTGTQAPSVARALNSIPWVFYTLNSSVSRPFVDFWDTVFYSLLSESEYPLLVHQLAELTLPLQNSAVIILVCPASSCIVMLAIGGWEMGEKLMVTGELRVRCSGQTSERERLDYWARFDKREQAVVLAVRQLVALRL